MEGESVCTVCHVTVRSTDFFCYNCGKNLHASPLSTSIESQIILYIKTICLPPLGIVWGIKYLRQNDQSSKIVGIITIVVTVVIVIVIVESTIHIVNTVNSQINSQMLNVQGL